MKINILLIMFVIVLAGCGGSKYSEEEKTSDLKNLQEEKEDFYQKLETGPLNYSDAMKLADSYKRFFDKYPDDELLPKLYMELADISISYLNDPKESIKYYKKVVDEYTDFENVPLALFMIATLSNDKLQDYQAAENYYNEFIQKYPDHELVNDAKVMLNNLGKTPEQILESIVKENQADSSVAQDSIN